MKVSCQNGGNALNAEADAFGADIDYANAKRFTGHQRRTAIFSGHMYRVRNEDGERQSRSRACKHVLDALDQFDWTGAMLCLV